MPSAHDMAREYRVLSGLNRVGFPAPTAVAECADVAVTGAPFMIMGFVPGPVIDTQAKSRGLTPPSAGTISTALMRTLADLHAVDLHAAGLSELGRPHGYLKRQVSRWSHQWELTKTRDLSSVLTLRDWLATRVSLLPEDLPFSLVHGDFRLDNVILDEGMAEVRAVLDWEMSTVGDPVADLAVTLTYWSSPQDHLRRLVPVADRVTEAPGFLSRSELVEEYVRCTGRQVDHLDVCVALACFKLAVIMESIHYRFLQGNQLGTSGEAGQEAMGRAAEALAELGLAVTRQGAIDGLAT
jgi:aminoglycoside phosphotransferase (APT) family kinase protein